MACRLRVAFGGITAEPAIFYYFLAIFLLYSVFQPTVFSKVCSEYLEDLGDPNITCDNVGVMNTSAAQKVNHLINADTNYWIKMSSICATLTSLVGDMVMGSWGDAFGRRLPLLLPSIGGLLATAVYLALVNIPTMGVAWLCVASLVSGIFGGYTGVVAASFAYISEVVEPASRSRRVSLAEGCIFLAATIGPFLSAALYSNLGNTGVFILHGLCHLANIIYCICLPEPRQVEQETSIRGLFSLSHFQDSLKTLVATREGHGRAVLFSLLLAFFLFQVASNGEQDILFLYLRDILGLQSAAYIFKFYYGFRNGLAAVALFLLLPVLKWVGTSDHVICTIGLISAIGGLIFFGLSTSITMIFLSGLVGGLTKFADPLLRSLISQVVEGSEVGKIFGVVAVCGDLANMSGTLIFNSAYAPLRALQPACVGGEGSCVAGLPYLLAAALLAIPIILVILAGCLVRQTSSGREGGEVNKAYDAEVDQ